jgi:hypothetical protein
VLLGHKERKHVLATALVLLALSEIWAMDSQRWVLWLHHLRQQPPWQLSRQVSLYPLVKHQTLEMVSLARPLLHQQQQLLRQVKLLLLPHK